MNYLKEKLKFAAWTEGEASNSRIRDNYFSVESCTIFSTRKMKIFRAQNRILYTEVTKSYFAHQVRKVAFCTPDARNRILYTGWAKSHFVNRVRKVAFCALSTKNHTTGKIKKLLITARETLSITADYFWRRSNFSPKTFWPIIWSRPIVR